MTRRIIAIVLIVLGLGTVGAAIASATVWKPDTVVTVPLPEDPSASYVVSDPGVLTIVNDAVKVRAVAKDPESPVFLAVGRTADVEAWVAESDHGKITGLETWEELTYENVPAVVPEEFDEEEADEPATDGEEGETPAANPADSDMWVEEANGVGEVTYTWNEVPGNWSMIFATDGENPAPMVELTWEREVPTPALIPGIILGALVTLAGLVLLIIDLRAARRHEESEEPEVSDVGETELGSDEFESTLLGRAATPEEIMAGVEAAASSPKPIIVTGEFDQPGGETLVDSSYPHLLEEAEAPEQEPEEEGRPLTRREIRERERARERAELLAGSDEETTDDRWPTQEEHRGAPAEPAPGRRWWQRKSAAQESAPPSGPIVLDDDTGEIIITGEIDLTRLNPRASADSWRATWGLDKDAVVPWLPVDVKEDVSGDEDE